MSPGQITGGPYVVEAAGQPVHLFRDGLDYAFILEIQDAERIIGKFFIPILVSAHTPSGASESMSLYRAAEVSLSLPLGVTMPFRVGLMPFETPSGFTDMSPVFTLSLQTRATSS